MQLPRRRILFALILGLVLTNLVAGIAPNRTAGAVRSDSRHFPETGHSVGGLFLDYWEQHGGVSQFGYPLSEEILERSDTDSRLYTVQYFERTVFEHHPENRGTSYEVLLSLL